MEIITEQTDNDASIRYTSLDTALDTPEQVICLDLSNQQIEILPESIDKLINLEVLILAGNPLKSLPVAIETLPKLKKFDITNTDISILKRVIKRKHLEELRCRNSLVNKSEVNLFQHKHPECKVEANPNPIVNRRLLWYMLKTVGNIFAIMALTYIIMLVVTPTNENTKLFFLYFVIFIVITIAIAITIKKVANEN